MFWIIRLYVTAVLFACCYVTRWGKFGRIFCKQTNIAACRFQNECSNKVEIALRVVQFWSEIKLVITNRTPASRSCDFVITRLISDQIALHSVTDETYTDAELARVSVLTLDVTKTSYVSPVASVWQVSWKILIRK